MSPNDKIDLGGQTPSPFAKSGKITEVIGDVTKKIGSGEHAQASIAYRSIGWSFLAGSVFTLALLLLAYLRGDKSNPIEDIKTIWAIFVPIITLILGYIFGRAKG